MVNRPPSTEKTNLFLMRRVELKVRFRTLLSSLLKLSPVPNAPCGVERRNALTGS